jgi:hypothetical protein
MTACIFIGPTVRAEEAAQVLKATYLPPAGHGDVYRATLRKPRPRVIGLIDGYFRFQPAVRHKEILWAMYQGIHVFGAASIGALRAAELADFGMVGVGRIFRDFHEGRLEDDDEVAVDHGPAEVGYLPLSDALVDIRATLVVAREQGVIARESEELLISIGKRTFYSERSYRALIDKATGEGHSRAELDDLRSWLADHKISRKREDAMCMLVAVREFLATEPPPPSLSYTFERTETWERDVAFAEALAVGAEGDGHLMREQLLEELHLMPELQRQVRGEALGRALALREAERREIQVSEKEVRTSMLRWAQVRKLAGPQSIAAWRDANHIDPVEFQAFIRDEARVSRLALQAQGLIDRHMVDVLRARGDYAALSARALDKQRFISNAGEWDSSQKGVSDFQVLAWFCEQRLECPLPHDVESFAAELCFSSTESFYRALRREHAYLESVARRSREAGSGKASRSMDD